MVVIHVSVNYGLTINNRPSLSMIEPWISDVAVPSTKFRVQRSKFRVQRSKFRVQRLKFRVQRLKFRVQRSKFQVQRSKFRVLKVKTGVMSLKIGDLRFISLVFFSLIPSFNFFFTPNIFTAGFAGGFCFLCLQIGENGMVTQPVATDLQPPLPATPP